MMTFINKVKIFPLYLVICYTKDQHKAETIQLTQD